MSTELTPIPFHLTTARLLAAKYGLSKVTVMAWKRAGRIPAQYADPDYAPPVLDEAGLARQERLIDLLLENPAISRMAYADCLRARQKLSLLCVVRSGQHKTRTWANRPTTLSPEELAAVDARLADLLENLKAVEAMRQREGTAGHRFQRALLKLRKRPDLKWLTWLRLDAGERSRFYQFNLGNEGRITKAETLAKVEEALFNIIFNLKTYLDS